MFDLRRTSASLAASAAARPSPTASSESLSLGRSFGTTSPTIRQLAGVVPLQRTQQRLHEARNAGVPVPSPLAHMSSGLLQAEGYIMQPELITQVRDGDWWIQEPRPACQALGTACRSSAYSPGSLAQPTWHRTPHLLDQPQKVTGQVRTPLRPPFDQAAGLPAALPAGVTGFAISAVCFAPKPALVRLRAGRWEGMLASARSGRVRSDL